MRGLAPLLRAAPIFPSLIEEGRGGGGYDVRFDLPAIPVMIQFKRPDVMLTARAHEINDHGLALTTPFYRMHIRSSRTSQQHDLLLGHDTGANLVLYASPCFHGIDDFNSHYLNKRVIDNTIFLRPSDIGPLSAEPHHVSYDGTAAAWCFSDEPKSVKDPRKGRGIAEDVNSLLKNDPRPFKEGRLPEALLQAERTLRQAGIQVRQLPSWQDTRLPMASRQLRKLADLSMTYLNAQLMIFQTTPQT